MGTSVQPQAPQAPQPQAPQVDPQAAAMVTPGENAAPDFTNLDKAARLMRAFSNVKPDNPNYIHAQVLFQAARREFIAEAAKHKAFYERQAAPAEAPSPDLGTGASARIGVAEGLGGLAGGILGGAAGSAIPVIGTGAGIALGGMAGTAVVKPLAELFSRAPASDVKQQWDATTAAHEGAQALGWATTSFLGGALSAFAKRFATKAAMSAEQLAQSQIKTKLMQRALQKVEERINSEVVQNGPMTEEAYRKMLKIKLPAMSDEMVDATINEARTQGKILGPNPSTGQVSTPQGAKVVQAVQEAQGRVLSPAEGAARAVARRPQGLDTPTFQRRAAANPFTPTAAEETARETAKQASTSAADAARTAYALAKAAGKSDEEAMLAAKRAAGFTRGSSSF